MDTPEDTEFSTTQSTPDAPGGQPVDFTDLLPFTQLTLNDGSTVTCRVDKEFPVGTSTTIYFYGSDTDRPRGEAIVFMREGEIVIKNADYGFAGEFCGFPTRLDEDQRLEIGARLVDAILEKYPTHRVSFEGENPTDDAIEWYKDLQKRHGDRLLSYN